MTRGPFDRRPPTYPIEAVDNALLVMLEIAGREEIRLKEVADLLGVARSSAHRLLAALQYRGFVDHHERDLTYGAGPALHHVGVEALRAMRLRHRASEVLRALSREIDETLHFARLEGNGVRFVDGVESTSHGLRVGTRVGMLLPAHTTAVGKVLLAGLAEDQIRSLFPRGLQIVTELTISTVEALLAELRHVTTCGYATNRSESERGVVGVAVGVLHGAGVPLAALGVTAPETRMSETRIQLILPSLHRAASALARHPDPQPHT